MWVSGARCVFGGASKKTWPAEKSVGLTRSNSFRPGFPSKSTAYTDTDTEVGLSGTLPSEPSISTPMPCTR